jgi:hypothetical protein
MGADKAVCRIRPTFIARDKHTSTCDANDRRTAL